MITAMLTKNTTELRTLVKQHVAADQVIQGTYWEPDAVAYARAIEAWNTRHHPPD